MDCMTCENYNTKQCKYVEDVVCQPSGLHAYITPLIDVENCDGWKKRRKIDMCLNHDQMKEYLLNKFAEMKTEYTNAQKDYANDLHDNRLHDLLYYAFLRYEVICGILDDVNIEQPESDN